MVELELIFMVCCLLPVWKNSRLNANIKKIDVKEMVSHYFPLISACMTASLAKTLYKPDVASEYKNHEIKMLNLLYLIAVCS